MGHIHARAMLAYAKDAVETDMPWERWEVSYPDRDEFRDLSSNPDWATNRKYRRKPKVIMINGYEVPEPQRVPLKYGEVYWTLSHGAGVASVSWQDDGIDICRLKNGFIHLTKEAAEKHFEALKSFTAVS